MKKPKTKTIEVVRSTYQPTKAKVEEEFSINVRADTVLERMKELGRVLTEPVNIRWIDKPRNRR